MKTTASTIETDGAINPVDTETALAEWRAGRGPFWIDLQSDTEEEIIAWGKDLGVDSGVLDLLQAGGLASKFLVLDDVVYFELPVLSGDPEHTRDPFGCLCLDRLVVTMNDRPVLMSKLTEDGMPRFKIQEPTTAGLVCGIITLESILLRRQAIKLGDRAQSLAGRMDDDPDSVSLAEILALKRKVLQLNGVTSDQLACIENLQVVDRPVLRLAGGSGRIQIALGNTRATDRSIDRLDRNTRDLQQRRESAQQDKTNQRLAVLTVLSAIFSPLALLTGVYGMNFRYMPELGYRYAYFIALGAMALIAGGLYWFFRSRGWLK